MGFAPTGVYPCKSVGTVEECGDRWIAISITSDDDWKALKLAMADLGWAADASLDSNAGRLAAHDLIDARLAEWTAQFDDYELFNRLQAAGIAAAPVLEGSRAFDDPHTIARNLYQPQTTFDGMGPYRFTSPFVRFPATPLTVRQPPVALGEHNEYVYKELLGVTDVEYQRLTDAGHIAMDFDASIP